MAPPAKLPLDFNQWDKGDAPPSTLPANFSGWDKPAAPAITAPVSSPPHVGFIQGIQNSFDENTRTSPKEPLLQTGLKSVVGMVGGPFVHPIKTATGLLDSIPSSPDLPNVPMLANGKTYLRDEGQSPIVSRGIQAYTDAKDGGVGYSATKLAGEALGAEALGLGVKSGTRAAGNVGSNLTALRESVVGNPDAAALRGLRVGPASNKTLRTLSAVEGSRPFLQGSNDLADLQSRIPAAKNEIWAPYSEAIDRIGDTNTKLGTVRDLERRRLEVSAQVRALKSGDPQAVALAQQKGLTQADLLSEEKQIKSVLDPKLREAGIDPVAIRRSFSDIGTIDRRVLGKSTIAEPDKSYGFGKLTDIDLHKPGKIPSVLAEGAKDIFAGRPLWKGKATDVAIREGFRAGGPKPNFRVRDTPFEAPQPRGYLEASTIGEPGGEDWTQGRIGTRPTIVPPAPASRLALPGSTGAGEVQPMIGVRRSIQPSLAEDYSRLRVSPTGFVDAPIIPERGFIAGPNGEVRGSPLFLEANEPRGLLQAPKKSRKR